MPSPFCALAIRRAEGFWNGLALCLHKREAVSEPFHAADAASSVRVSRTDGPRRKARLGGPGQMNPGITRAVGADNPEESSGQKQGRINIDEEVLP